ncbi:MAG: hypothetical protein GWP06_03990 [Actinobacteria bacterium]|nr:hypothetical protein [Actinomycetota bacterium]
MRCATRNRNNPNNRNDNIGFRVVLSHAFLSGNVTQPLDVAPPRTNAALSCPGRAPLLGAGHI